MFELEKRKNPVNVLRLLDSTRNEIDNFGKLFDEMFHFHGKPTFGNLPSPEFSPSLDIVEKKDKYIIDIEAPGMSEDAIEISLYEKENILCIKGEKTQENKEKGDDYFVREISYGSFRREIPLPKNIEQDIKASYKNGVLKLIIHKKEKEKEENKIKKIKIEK